MRKLFTLALFISTFFSVNAHGQTYVTVTGTNIQDSGGNLLQSGRLCFAPADNNGKPIGIRSSGSGQVVNTPQCVPVLGGAITPASGSFQLINTATAYPANFCYSVTLTTANGGTLPSGYGCVQMSTQWCTTTGGTETCIFDNYNPSSPAQAIIATGPAGPVGPVGDTGATGPTGGAANIATSVPGLPCVYTSTNACGGIDPSVGRYGNGTVSSGIAPLNAVRNVPLMGTQLKTTGWSGSIFWGNSIVAGVGYGETCSTGTNPATGTCFADLLAQATGTSSTKTNYAVGGDQVCDTVAHALNTTPPTGNAHVYQVFLNLLNDADVKGRGAYQDVARGCLEAFELFATSTPATRFLGSSATGTGFTSDTTFSGWPGIVFTATGQVATFSIPIANGGRATAPQSLFVLYRTLDLPASTNIPGSIAVNVNASPQSTYISNASPVDVATQNGTTSGILAREIPNVSLSATNTVTVTSLFQGSQNWAEVLGFVTSPIPYQISSYTIASGIPTFTSLNGVPAVGQVLSMMDYSTGTYFNAQTVTVVSANSGSGTFTVSAVSGTPTTVGATSESFALAYPSEPGLWVAGSSRNLRGSESNERDVNTYDQLAQDSVRHLRGVGFQSVLNFVNTQTSWLQNSLDMGPGLGQHHPTEQGELELEAAFLAPTYEPMQTPGNPYFNRTVGRTVITTGPCTLTTTDDTVTVYSASANICTLPDMISTVAAANNNQVVRIHIVNAGTGVVTVNSTPGENWTDSGIQLLQNSSVTVESTMQTSTGLQGRYYTYSKNGIVLTPTCAILPGATYTIPVGTTCIYASGGATQSYTWPTSGFTIGVEYTIINPVGSVGDIAFTNQTPLTPVHPGCSEKFMATTTAVVKPEGNAVCNGNNWVSPTTFSTASYTLLETDQRLLSSNTGATTITLPSTWSAGFQVTLKNQGSGSGVWSFSGESSGNTTTKVVIPGELATLIGGASGQWDVYPSGPVFGTTASIGGSALAAGACASGTASIPGAAAGMALTQPSPSVDPGAGFEISPVITATGTVTVRVCNISGVSATPIAATYNIGVTP